MKIKGKRELFLLQNTSRWPISSVGCLFSARPSSKRSLSVETSHERSVKPRSRDSNARRVHEFSCFRSAEYSVGKLSQRKWSNAPGEFNNRGGRYTWSFLRVSRDHRFHSWRTLVDTVSIDWHFRRTFVTSSTRVSFLFSPFPRRIIINFGRYRMTVFIAFKGNFISSY